MFNTTIRTPLGFLKIDYIPSNEEEQLDHNAKEDLKESLSAVICFLDKVPNPVPSTTIAENSELSPFFHVTDNITEEDVEDVEDVEDEKTPGERLRKFREEKARRKEEAIAKKRAAAKRKRDVSDGEG